MSFPQTPVPRQPGFVVGHGERAHLGEGWWERHEWPGRPGLQCRTAQTRGDLRLHAEPGQTELRLLLAASVALIGEPARVRVARMSEDGEAETLGEIVIPFEDWAVHAIPCPIAHSGEQHFTLTTETPCVPDHTLHNGDHRELGVHLAAAHLC